MRIGFNVTPLKSGHQTRGIGSYTRNLLNEFKKTSVEIIEFTNQNEIKDVDLIFDPWFDLFFRTLKVGEIPTVVTIHDVMPLIFSAYYPTGIRGKINLFWQKKALKQVKAVVTGSEVSKRDIYKYLGVDREKIKVIPISAGEEFIVLPENQKIKVKKQYNLPDNFLLYVGDGNYVKNLPFFIKGFSHLKSKLSNLKLILVGGAFINQDLNHPELSSLRELHQLIKENNLEGYVIMPGQIPLEDLIGFYNLASAYVQPSLYEGFGLPLLEAFQCGCPVISSNGGSLKEVGGQAVEYFDPTNLNEMVDKIESVLTNEKLRKGLIEKGFEQVKKFSWQKTAERTIDVFKSVLEK